MGLIDELNAITSRRAALLGELDKIDNQLESARIALGIDSAPAQSRRGAEQRITAVMGARAPRRYKPTSLTADQIMAVVTASPKAMTVSQIAGKIDTTTAGPCVTALFNARRLLRRHPKYGKAFWYAVRVEQFDGVAALSDAEVSGDDLEDERQEHDERKDGTSAGLDGKAAATPATPPSPTMEMDSSVASSTVENMNGAIDALSENLPAVVDGGESYE